MNPSTSAEAVALAEALEAVDGREVVVACEVQGYSFSGITFSNAKVVANIDDVWKYYSPEDFFVQPE